MELFYDRTGDEHTLELPNDIENVQIDINGRHIVSVAGTHSGDGRVGTTKYEVGVQLGTDASIDTVEHDDFAYIKVVERGDWRGDMRLSIVTLSEVTK